MKIENKVRKLERRESFFEILRLVALLIFLAAVFLVTYFDYEYASNVILILFFVVFIFFIIITIIPRNCPYCNEIMEKFDEDNLEIFRCTKCHYTLYTDTSTD
ncbi:MAG: zf-TFIIB domain-containing protein [Spirochaetes bacterium]|nr:zf-TFIIB domain-containing protein [Spirochaetota bacterium]